MDTPTAQPSSTDARRRENFPVELRDNYEVTDMGAIGKGLVAKRPFKQGDIISHSWIGPEDEGDFRVFDQTDSRDKVYGIQIGVTPEGRGIYYTSRPYSPRQYLNHSCNPNAGLRDTDEGNGVRDLQLIAIKDIQQGEQLTIDYSTTQFEPRTSPVGGCKCGEPECRKTIRPFPELPPELQDRYLEAGAVFNYIAEAIQQQRQKAVNGRQDAIREEAMPNTMPKA